MLALTKFSIVISFLLILLYESLYSYIQNERIVKFGYASNDGGKGGGFTHFKIDKDSIWFSNGSRLPKTYELERKTPSTLWNKLSKTNLAIFKKIKSGELTAPSDDEDPRITIYINLKEYTVVNGDYPDFRDMSFVDIIEKEVNIIKAELYEFKKQKNEL